MLMVHTGETPMSVPEILEFLEPGDCITHCASRINHTP